MMKKNFIFLCLIILVIGACTNNSAVEEPVKEEKPIQCGEVGEQFVLNDINFSITNNFPPYAVKIVKSSETKSPYRVCTVTDENGIELVIPSVVDYKGQSFSVEEIDEGVFYGRTDIESVYIPGSVKIIGFNAFRMCTFKKLILGNGISHIEAYAFSQCKYITELDLPGSLELIGACAFSECYRLQRIIFEDGIQEIGAEAFTRRVYPTGKTVVYSYSMVPPKAPDPFFNYTNCILYVPADAYLDYLRYGCWRFFDIRKM